MHEQEMSPQHATRPAKVRADGAGTAPPHRELLTLQRSAGNAAVAAALEDTEQQRSPVLDVIGHGGGSPMPAGLRTDMESRFGGADFSSVRLHTGGPAADSAASVQAQAYTVGDEIVLGAGREDVHSDAGRHTVAHELTHVLQQRGGAVDGTEQGGGVRVSDPGDRFERAAEANAAAVLAGPGAVQRHEEDAAPAAPDVQRQGPEEPEEEVPA
ncbi:hypothetical protein Cs7R123_26030 [Catellatospora sp. TT07R-123]|uniref:eCIS core domain-containing protein n=1 Tax=Catellatospora sp. TT07R-123 TaxID=2733863 RepID=UPI001B0EC2D1|nr:DUF4157 domain-containing protein [Catellatospora sp. TT07R-123]GHJ45261.1 hypothetical protein Cs7R123_26030 [Catellatospora sp. TT07R-123]